MRKAVLFLVLLLNAVVATFVPAADVASGAMTAPALTIADLPGKATAATRQRLGTGTVIKITKTEYGGSATYHVDYTDKGGAARTFDVNADGTSPDSDWPQFRGPNRDGVVLVGPKIAESWTKDGPPLIWKSAPILSGPAGGDGSVAISHGRAYVFAHQLMGKPGVALVSEEMLKNLGWAEGIPDTVVKLIEEFQHDRSAPRRDPVALDAYITAKLATLDEAMRKQYAEWFTRRSRPTIGSPGSCCAVSPNRMPGTSPYSTTYSVPSTVRCITTMRCTRSPLSCGRS